MPKSKKEIAPEEEVIEEQTDEIVDPLNEPELPVEKEEEKPTETVTEPEEKKEVPVVEEKPDLESLKAELKEEITKETADKIAQALKGEDATVEEKDKYQKMAEDFQKEHGRNPTWHELIPALVEDAKEALKKDQEKLEKEKQDIEAKQKEDYDRRLKEFNDEIDAQLEDLYALKKLPEIKDKDDVNDYGVQARSALFKTMMEVNQARTKEGKKPIYSIKEIFYEHYTLPKKEVAGADAPVSAGRGGAVSKKDDEYSYEEIHGSSIYGILNKK